MIVIKKDLNQVILLDFLMIVYKKDLNQVILLD